MPYQQTKNVKLYYEEDGNPEDPPIVLIMGLATQLIAWPPALRQKLASRGYRVICFDNRDCGYSSKMGSVKPNIAHHLAAYRLGISIKSPYTLLDMAYDTLELLAGLGIERAHIVGASMGGMIGQVFAAHFPNNILSLTSIMSTSGSRKVPLPKRRLIRRLLEKSKVSDPEEYINHSIKTIQMIQSPDYPTDEQELRHYLETAYQRSHYPLGYIRQLTAILASGDRSSMLQRIACPTLVMHGKADPLSPVYGGVHTALQIPGAQLKLIEGMGHNFPSQLIPKITDLIIEHIDYAEARLPQRNAG